MMGFITHNDDYFDEEAINGSHRQGYIEADYERLLGLFGKPHCGDGYKVDWEWSIEFEDGEIATIYNWKSGPNYGCYDVGPGQIKTWNVGGFSQRALTNLEKVINAA
tara:strand:- start:340 stop:660 length:321 start_codon:yes stop_codon:yes gene_type:complete